MGVLGGRPEEGSASSIGLIVAAATFMGAFVFAQAMVAEPGGMDPRPLALEQQATTAIDLLVQQSGKGSAGDWGATPDGMQRFGLSKDGQPNFLDYVKIKALRNGTMTAAANNAPDYPDARTALGLSLTDFHLRSYPVLPSFEDPRWTKDPRGRLAYVGHFDSPRGYATMGAWANTTGDRLNVSLAIRNDGTTPHIFVASIGIGNQAEGDVIATQQRHTLLLQPGDVQTVWANFPRMSYSPALTGVKLDLTDGYGNTIVAPYWLAATAPSTGSSQPWAPHLAAAEQYYQAPDEVVFIADHFEGDGTRMNQDQTGRFVLVGPDGTEIANQSVTLPKSRVYKYECETCTTPGAYVGTLWNPGLTHRARDVVYVSSSRLFTESETMSLTAQKEIQLIQELVGTFNGQAYLNGSYPGGDVFSDSTHVRDLPDVIDRYTMIVVGSEVKQNALNAAGTKWAIADWVQAGGNLIVLGTVESQSNWLEPVYKAAQSNANGGISAPDPTHPVLSTPERLDYSRYLDNARAWRIRDDQPFTNVLERSGAPGGQHDSTLAIANPGAYNDGTVVLTSYMPAQLTSPQDDTEAKRLLHNLFSQSYNMLFLDYGPPVPDNAPVGAAQRLTAVPHPNVPGAVVEVRLVMYLFD